MGGAILEKIGKEAAEVAAKKAAEDAAKRAAEAAAKKAAEDAAKRAAEDAAKKAAEDAAKKAAEDAAKKASEDAAKKAAEDAAKKAAEDAAKKAAEDAAKKAAEDAAKKGAETAAKTSGLRTAGALTRDFTLGASKVISNLPVVGPFLKTIGVGGGLYELGKYIFSSHSGPEKPEGATQIKGPDGKMHDVRPISPEEAKTRKPEDFAKDENGNPAKDANGNPYVYYNPNDPNETHHDFGFVDTAIKWIADIEKNPSIAPFAPYINMGIAALAVGAIGSFFNSTIGLLMGLAVAAFMFFKGNDFIKDRAASIDNHDQWKTKHYFNPSAQGTTQTQTPDPNSQQRTPDPNTQRPTGPAP